MSAEPTVPTELFDSILKYAIASLTESDPVRDLDGTSVDRLFSILNLAFVSKRSLETVWNALIPAVEDSIAAEADYTRRYDAHQETHTFESLHTSPIYRWDWTSQRLFEGFNCYRCGHLSGMVCAKCCEVGSGYCRLVATTDLANLQRTGALPLYSSCSAFSLLLGFNQAPDRHLGSDIAAYDRDPCRRYPSSGGVFTTPSKESDRL